MRLPILQNSIWTALGLAACLILVACNKTDAAKKTAAANAPLPRLNWNLKTLEEYQKAGHTNPNWDELAKSALNGYAQIRSQPNGSNEDWLVIISNSSVAAVEAGCDDPMIRYLQLRYATDLNRTPQEIADAFCKVGIDMQRSSYPSIRKFYAWMRAGKQIRTAYGKSTNFPEEVNKLGVWNQMVQDLTEAVSDPTMPTEEVYEACHECLQNWNGGPQYAKIYHQLQSRFSEDWKNDPVIILLEGEADTQIAWAERGTGFANTVTAEGWNKFSNGLVTADQVLAKAWKLNPKDPRIAHQMMTLELGQGLGRDRMELWFGRAMELNPNDYDACSDKLNYLKPKWYGTEADMLAFGRECVENEHWGGHVPLILVDAHYSIQRDFTAESEKPNYWKRPEIWPDIKHAYDRFFELNPKEVSLYNNYAWYAYKCEQWADFNALIPKIASVNYYHFGGKDKFELMVATAKERAGKGKAKD